MNHPFISELREPTLIKVTGTEALTFVERLDNYIREFSLGIDKRFASIKASIHPIDYSLASINSRGLNFFDHELVAIPCSEMFDRTKMPWHDYVSYVLNGIPLITNLKDETGRMYDWIKNVAATGKVSRSFRYSLTGMDELVSSTEEFVKTGITPNKHRTAHLRDLYPSWTVMFQLVDRYNKNVKCLRGRDLEIISKQLDEIKRLGDLVIQKVRANDLVLTQNDLSEIADSMDYFNRSVVVAGAIAGLINELRDVLAGQCDVIKGLRKK